MDPAGASQTNPTTPTAWEPTPPTQATAIPQTNQAPVPQGGISEIPIPPAEKPNQSGSPLTPPGLPSFHDAPGLEEEHTGMPFILKIGIGIGVLFVIVLLILFVLNLRKNSSSTEKVTLTYWGLWEDKSTMANILNEFTKEHPNITVDYVQQDPKQYTERLVTRIQNGNGPDVFRLHNTWLPFLQPLMSPLSQDTISAKDFDANYFPVIKTDFTRNGAIYAVPAGIDTLSLFVNTSLLQKAGVSVPTNWNDFVTASRTLTVVDATGKIKTAGAALGTYDNVTHAPDIVSLLLLQSGVNPANITKNAQNASDALSFYTSFASGKSAVWDSSQEPSWSLFAKGGLAMYFGYSWDIFQMKGLNPNLTFAVYPVPQLPGGQTTVASYWGDGISNKGKHQKEAQLLIAYLAKKETLQKLYTEEAKTRLFGEPYPRTDLATTVKDTPYVATFEASAPNAKSSYFAGETYDTAVNIPLNNYLGDAVRGILTGTSPQTAVNTLSQGAAQILSRYGIK